MRVATSFARATRKEWFLQNLSPGVGMTISGNGQRSASCWRRTNGAISSGALCDDKRALSTEDSSKQAPTALREEVERLVHRVCVMMGRKHRGHLS